ncbi:MAG: hypothetical protein OXE99_07555 [Cellvibrionales bacterium]|nr:hypothetical protein [Cellvibrionales bacterium]
MSLLLATKRLFNKVYLDSILSSIGSLKYAVALILALATTQAEEYQSQAFNLPKTFKAQVNPATGNFNYSYPVIHLKGIREQLQLNLTYQYSYKGNFGLPKGWHFDIDYIDKNVAYINGSQWLIDPLWRDITNYSTGLRYNNQHGLSFKKLSTIHPLPGKPLSGYLYRLQRKDGSKKYFSATGLLLLESDRFNNRTYYEYTSPNADVRTARLKSIQDNYGNVHRFSYSPSNIMITLADNRKLQLYLNNNYLLTIIDPEGQQTSFTYTDNKQWPLIKSITEPTGMLMSISYGSINGLISGNEKKLPVVTELRHQDLSTNNLLQEIFYTYSTYKNYTGYPEYQMNSERDSLVDSNDTTYRYSVEVKQTDLQSIDPQINTKIYTFNSLHLPMEIKTLANNQPYDRLVMDYDLIPFKYAKTTNYDKPKKITHEMWHAEKADFVPVSLIEKQYDLSGNQTYELSSIFHPINNQWLAKKEQHWEYHTENFNLLKKSTKLDKLSGYGHQITYALAPNGKSNQTITSYIKSPGNDETWSPFRTRDILFDNSGRKIKETKRWSFENQHGVKQSEQSFRYEFNKNNRQLTVTKTRNGHAKHQLIFDSRNNQKLSTLTPTGAKTQYEYDKLNRLTKLTNPLGDVTKVEYFNFQQHGENSRISTSPMGNQKKSIFDAMMRKKQQLDKYQGTWRLLSSYEHNGFNQVIQSTNRLGLTTIKTYDSLQRLLSVIDTDKNELRYVYNDTEFTTDLFINGKKVQSTQREPHQFNLIEYLYTFSDNPHSTEEVKTQKKETQYNGFEQPTALYFGQISTKTGVYNQELSIKNTYDYSGNVIDQITETQDQQIRHQRSVYDLFDNKIHTSHEMFKDNTQYKHQGPYLTYNADNLLTKKESQALTDGTTVSNEYYYDDAGKLTSSVSSLGEAINYTYDLAGQMISSQWHRNMQTYQTNMKYDKDGKLTHISDNGNKLIRYQYAENQKIASIVYPDNRSINYQYDDYDRVIKYTDVFNNSTYYTYAHQDLGKLSSAYNAHEKYRFIYNTDDNGIQGKLVAKERIVNHLTATPSIRKTHLQYDHQGLIARSHTEWNDIQQFYQADYTYDAHGLITKQKITWSGENEDNIHIEEKSFTYDNFKSLTELSYMNNASPSQDTRLIYSRDGNNNVLKESIKRHNEEIQDVYYQYNAMNQLIEICSESGCKNQHYDKAGRLIKDVNDNHFNYDAKNHLLAFTSARGETIHYDYYPNGLVQQQKHQCKTKSFYYDTNNRITAIENNNDPISLHRLDNQVISINEANAYSTCINSCQDISAKIGDNQKITPIHYDAYGLPLTKNTESTAQDFGWQQLYTDSTTQLTYMQNRFFHQKNKQFLTPDSKLVLNAYGLAQGNPTNLTDPTGQSATGYALGGISIGLGIAGGILSILFPPAAPAAASFASYTAASASALGVASGSLLIGSQAAVDNGHHALGKSLLAASFATAITSSVIGIGGTFFAPSSASSLASVNSLSNEAKLGAISEIEQVSEITTDEVVEFVEADKATNFRIPDDIYRPFEQSSMTGPPIEEIPSVTLTTVISRGPNIASPRPGVIDYIINSILGVHDLDLNMINPFSEYESLNTQGIEVISGQIRSVSSSLAMDASNQTWEWRLQLALGATRSPLVQELLSPGENWEATIIYTIYMQNGSRFFRRIRFTDLNEGRSFTDIMVGYQFELHI